MQDFRHDQSGGDSEGIKWLVCCLAGGDELSALLRGQELTMGCPCWGSEGRMVGGILRLLLGPRGRAGLGDWWAHPPQGPYNTQKEHVKAPTTTRPTLGASITTWCRPYFGNPNT